jgi:LysR family nitrogen assimilation transcriptional regulator
MGSGPLKSGASGDTVSSMNLRQLKYFIGIVEAGNMTRAAEAMNVAQTALSAQIRQLEEDLGVALLVRHSRGIEPTEAGRLLHARGLTILKMVEEARRETVAVASASHERVKFGITPALMLSIGADLIERVSKECPNVSFSLVEAMSHVLLPDVVAGQLNYALCYDVPDQPQVSRIAFLQEDLVFVTRPSRHSGQQIALVDALSEVLAMPEESDTVRMAVAAASRDIGADLKVAHEVRSISAMKTLAVRGTASCILPLAAVAEEVAAGTLAAHPIFMPPVRRTLYLVSSSHCPEFRCHPALVASVRVALGRLIELLGPLAHPLWTRGA